MPVQPNKTPNGGCAEVDEPPAFPARAGSRPTQFKQGERERIRRLASMPGWMYRETVDRLIRGQSCAEVARWILRQPHRGGISDVVSLHVLCQYLAHLADRCAKQQIECTRSNLSEVRGDVNEIPVFGRRLSVPQYVTSRLPVFNRRQYLIALVHTQWETLEHYRLIEEPLAARGLPTQQFANPRAKIAKAMISAIAEMAKQELSDANVQKMMQSLGMVDCPQTDSQVDAPEEFGGRLSSITERPAELTGQNPKSEREPKEPPIFADCSPADEQLARSIFEDLYAMTKLKQARMKQEGTVAAQLTQPGAESGQPVDRQRMKSA